MIVLKKVLFDNRDLQYKEFISKLVPDIDPDKIVGVRTPILRKIASGNIENSDAFLKNLPHDYYEENNIHAFIINKIKAFDECIIRIAEFLPYVDNWATCDGLRPACFANNKDKLLLYILRWLKSDKTYTVRFGVEMLMVYYLDDDFDEKFPEIVSHIKSDEYYIKMMQAWYFATALCKQWDVVVKYLEDSVLSVWVHNKTIQKAIESHRITQPQKEYLKSLKRKAVLTNH